MVCFLAACFTKFLTSRKWLPVPYLPQNQWPTPSVVPTTASPSINPSVMANFTFPFSSSSANFQPPFCSLPVSSGVAHPASSLNPILQQASTSLHPILQQASTSLHPILQQASTSPDPILQEAIFSSPGTGYPPGTCFAASSCSGTF